MAATIDELMEIIPAPDFPTAGIIYGLNGVREGYRTADIFTAGTRKVGTVEMGDAVLAAL